MMPPPKGTPKPELSQDCVPYPNEMLTLGRGRYLLKTGAIVTDHPGCHPCDLTPQTRKYWEATALRGQGKLLEELLSPLTRDVFIVEIAPPRNAGVLRCYFPAPDDDGEAHNFAVNFKMNYPDSGVTVIEPGGGPRYKITKPPPIG